MLFTFLILYIYTSCPVRPCSAFLIYYLEKNKVEIKRDVIFVDHNDNRGKECPVMLDLDDHRVSEGVTEYCTTECEQSQEANDSQGSNDTYECDSHSDYELSSDE